MEELIILTVQGRQLELLNKCGKILEDYTDKECENCVYWFLGILSLNLFSEDEIFKTIFSILKFRCLDLRLDIKQFKKYRLIFTILKCSKKMVKNSKLVDVFEHNYLKSKGLLQQNSKQINLSNIQQIVHSFRDNRFLETLLIPKDQTDKVAINRKNFELGNTQEMVNRMSSMINLFGLKFIKFLNLELVEYQKFIKISYEDRVDFYCRTVKKIIDGYIAIKEIIQKKEDSRNRFMMTGLSSILQIKIDRQR